MKRRVALSFSSGKDSAWCLHVLQQRDDIEVVALLCSLDGAGQRVGMHGTPVSLVRAQAAAAGLPLVEVDLPWPCSNADYERHMTRACADLKSLYDAEAIAFGDLYLEDIRRYREDKLAGTGLEPLFPLWGEDTGELAEKIIDAGLEAVVCALDTQRLPASLCGARYDHDFLARLPKHIDPCGENGEFHSFVTAGPQFNHSLAVSIGETTVVEGFAFAALKPGELTSCAS